MTPAGALDVPRPATACRVGQATTVEVVTSLEGLVALGPDWNALVRPPVVDHPFLSHDWVRTWWEAFGGGAALRVLVARRGGAVVAIAPLMRLRTRLYGLPVRQLASIGNVYTERFDVPLAPDAGDALGRLLGWMLERREPWDLVRLAQVPATSPLPAAVEAAAGGAGRLGLWHPPATPFVPLTGSLEEYLARRSAKHRANLRNRQRRLERVGPVRLETVEGGDLAPALADAFRLEASAWKAREGTAILSDPAATTFYTRLAERAAARGWLRLHFLTVGDRRIAVEYCLAWGARLFFLKGGYDPAWAPYSPSNLLFAHVVADGFRRRLAEIDFLGGPEPWKAEWTDAARPHRWLYLFAPGLRGRLLHAIKFGRRALTAGGGAGTGTGD